MGRLTEMIAVLNADPREYQKIRTSELCTRIDLNNPEVVKARRINRKNRKQNEE